MLFTGGLVPAGWSGTVFKRRRPVGSAVTLTDILPSAAVPESAYPSCDPHTVLNPTTTIQTHLTTRSAFTRSKELALEGKMWGSEGEEKEENRVQVKVLKSERGIDRTAEVGRVPKNCTQVKVKIKVIVWIVTWVRVKKYRIKNYSSRSYTAYL